MQRLLLLRASLIVAGLAMAASFAPHGLGQDRLRNGQEVEVQIRGQWHAAEVLRTMPDGQSVQVRIQEGGRPQVGVVPRARVRALETKAAPANAPAAAPEGELRTWSDATGQFRIEAALVAKEGGSVRLRKKDGTEISVPLSKLSRADVEYLATAPTKPAVGKNAFNVDDTVEVYHAARWWPAKVLKVDGERCFIHYDGFGDSWDEWVGPDRIRVLGSQVAAGAPAPTPSPRPQTPQGVPALQVETAICQLNEIAAATVEKLAPPQNAQADPALEPAPRAGVATLRRLEIFESVTNFLPADPASGTFLVAIAHKPPGKTGSTQLMTYDLADGKTLGQTTLPGAYRLAAGSAAVGWLATTPVDPPTQVVLWKWPRGDAAPQATYAVSLATDAPQHYATQVSLVAPAVQERMVIVTRGGQVVLWNTATRRAEKRWEASNAAVSPGGRYLAVHANEGIAIFDLSTSQQLGYWPVGAGLVNSLAFSPQGSQVACQMTDDLMVFDLRSGKVRFAISLPQGTVSAREGGPLWTSENHVLLGQEYLFDLNAGFVVWRYASPPGRGAANMTSAGGSIAYLATTFGRSRATVLRCMSLPHEQVQEALASLDPTQLFGLAPGAEVALQVNLPGGDAEKVRAALEKKATANGWKINPNAKASLAASVAPGEAEEGTFHDGPGFGGPTTTVRIQTFISTLDVMIDGEKVWTRSTRTGLPGALIAPAGKSIQEAAAAYEKPNLDFFFHLDVPSKFVRPKYLQGLGQSNLSATGIEGA